MSGATLFSIGHSNHAFERFLALLRRHDIDLVADVRARPFSRHVPHVSKDRLTRLLSEAGVGYAYLGRELGGVPPRNAPAPVVRSFAERTAEPGFARGIASLLDLARAHRTAMLCRERDPLDCHRFHLIGRALRDRATMWHILPDGLLEPHALTEQRLVERAGEGALPLFAGQTDDEAIARAYEAAWVRFR